MATLKRRNANGDWDLVQVTGEDVNTLRNDVDGLTTELAQKVRKGDLFVNVKDYGATGDGVTDDTEAFQAAIDAHHHVLVPPGKYLVNNLIPSKGLILEGIRNYPVIWASGLNSYQNAELIGNGVAGDYVIKNTKWTTDNQPNAVIIKHLTIDGNNKSMNGVYLGDQSIIDSCEIKNCDIGVYYMRTRCKIHNSELHHNNKGVMYMVDSVLNDNVFHHNTIGAHLFNSNDNDVTNNRFEWNDDTGIYLESAVFNKLIGNTCDRNTKYGVYLKSVTNVNMNGNILERNLVNNLYIDGATGCTFSGNQFVAKNSNDDQSGTVVPTYNIKVKSGGDSVISGNVVTGGSKMFDPTYEYKQNLVIENNMINGKGDLITVTGAAIPVTLGQTVTQQISYPDSNMYSYGVHSYKITFTGVSNFEVPKTKDILIYKNMNDMTITITNNTSSDKTYNVSITLKRDSFYF